VSDTGHVPSGRRRTLVRMAVPGIVAHLDLDAFYAAVEELENPELRSQALIVGGDPRGRGVVATANYNAREFGIHSAMSCAEALRRCPQAVFVRPRHSLYREYSRSVWETVRGIVPTVEQTGMDEGYLDIGAAIAFGGGRGEVAPDFLAARSIAEAVRTAVRAATSLTCSLGVAPCKVVAKIASDARKPGGLVVVPAGKERSFLAPLAVRRLPGVGPKAEQRLVTAGIETIGQLAALSDDELRRVLAGSVGTMLRERARGIDPRGLEQSAERISVSVENTFERDVSDRERLHDELRGMAAEVAEALQRRRQVARTVTTKLRYADFSIRSRSTSLDAGIDDGATIGDLACHLLDRGLRDRPGALRLVGVGVSGLGDFRQLALETG
jgi:DNA polymerase IV